MIYNHCGKCKNDLNKYFCKNCNKNICAKCYEKCEIEKHVFINLDEFKEKSNFCLTIIKKFLDRYIIPMKEINENSIKEENNEDILLIIEIISQDYINFFHLENILKIIKYIIFLESNNNINIYDGFGKLIVGNGNYYIGQFKFNAFNGKGKLFYKNGNMWYEGDFINGKVEGYGKWIHSDGNYYIGQFKDNVKHGKGISYDKNGNVKYEGEFINDNREGNGKLFYEDGNYYVG